MTNTTKLFTVDMVRKLPKHIFNLLEAKDKIIINREIIIEFSTSYESRFSIVESNNGYPGFSIIENNVKIHTRDNSYSGKVIVTYHEDFNVFCAHLSYDEDNISNALISITTVE